MLSDCCPVCLSCPVRSVCNIDELWPNGWMDQVTSWYGGRPSPRPHCFRWGPNSPHRKGHSSPPPTFQTTLLCHGRPSQQLLSSFKNRYNTVCITNRKQRIASCFTGSWLLMSWNIKFLIYIACIFVALDLVMFFVDHWSYSTVMLHPLNMLTMFSQVNHLFMVALCNRADHYIFALWFLSSSFSFPRLISAVGDWMSTILLHMAWP